MKKNITIVSLIVAIFVVLFITIGASYSLWTTSVNQVSVNTIDVGCFRISFVDRNIDGAGDISLANSYPMKNEDGMQLIPYMFIIENQCNVAATYNVNLETLTTSSLDESKLNVYFNNSSIKTYVPNVVNGLTADAKNGMNLMRGYLPAGDSVTYSLRVWIDYDVSVDTPNIQGKTWNGRIAVNSEATFSKPIFTNKIVGEDNVTLDIDTRSSKTISSLTCYYGDKNSQEIEGTNIGTTKCQYPLSAEYAKYTVSYSDGTSDISISKQLIQYFLQDGVELIPFSGYNTNLTRGNGYISANFGNDPFNEGIFNNNRIDVTKYSSIFADYGCNYTLQNNGYFLPVIMIPNNSGDQSLSIRGFDMTYAFSDAGTFNIDRSLIRADINENNLYENAGEQADPSLYDENDFTDTYIGVGGWANDGNTYSAVFKLYNLYAQLKE